MRTPSWRQWLNQTFGIRRNPNRASRRVVLRLEDLEERVVPTAPVVFTVNTTNDTNQAVAGTDPHDSNNNISLRSAIEAANHENTNSVGTITINFASALTQNGPATFILSLTGPGDDNGLTADDIVVGSNTNLATTISGPGDPTLIVIKPASPGPVGNGNDIFESAFDTNTAVNNGADLPLVLTIQNVTLTGAGAGAIFTGGDNGTNHSVTNLTNDVFQGNTDDFAGGGGAVTNDSGDLNVSNCVFEDNSATGVTDTGGEGGAINFLVDQLGGAGSHGSLSVTHSAFIDNTAAEQGAAGGAIFVSDVTGGGNSITVSGSTFTGNQATSSGGTGGAIASVGTLGLSISGCDFSNNSAGQANGTNSEGGAVAILDGSAAVASITDTRFSHNQALGTSSAGGAVIDSSILTLSDSTFFDDTAGAGGGVENSGGTVTANDDFWGANGGPNATGSDSTGGTVTVARYLELEAGAAPTSILPNGTASITADVFKENTGGPLAPGSLAGLPAGPISFTNAAYGNAVSAQALPSAAISSVSEAGNIVTVKTQTAHLLTPGQLVSIQSVTVGGYNGTFVVLSVSDNTTFTYEDAAQTNAFGSSNGTATALAQLSGIAGISSLNGNGTTVTVTTTQAHGFFNGQKVTISGVANAAFDGTFTIAFINATQFSYLAGTASSSTGGVAFLDGAANAVYTAGAIAGKDTVDVNFDNQVTPLDITVTPTVTANTTDLPANAASITIAGTGFDPNKAHDSVAFNDGAVGTVTSAGSTSLTVTFSTKPVTAGSLTAVVTVNGADSSSTQVATVIPVVTPSTTGLPINATSVTISGFGFDTDKTKDVVTFDDGAAGTVTSATATSLTVTFTTSPTAVGPLDASVAVDTVSSGSPVQVATVIPVVTPSTTGLPINAATLTISGFGFDTDKTKDVVTFDDGAAGTVTSATATSLTVTFTTSPTAVGPLDASVAVDTVSSGSPVQVATVIPVVTPSTTGLPINAATLTISGFGFDTDKTKDVVTFDDGAAGTVTSATATSLTVTFSTNPSAVGSLTAAVTVDTISSGSPVQVATVIPVVTPSTTGLPINAATLTISGFGFDTDKTKDVVTFDDGAAGTVTSATASSLTVTFTTSPTAVGPLDASVAVDTVSSGSPVQVATVIPVVTPSTTGLPINAATLTISGFGFDTDKTKDVVTFDDGAAGTVTSATATSLTVTFTTSPTAVGPLDASVAVDTISSGSPVQVATVIPVVTPSTTGLPINATSVTISGFGFDTDKTKDVVTFDDGAAGTVTSATATSLTVTFTTSPTAVGPLDASVAVDTISSGSPVQVATVIPVVTPSTTGLPINATSVTISGFGFDTDKTKDVVTFDDGAAGTVTSATATSLTVTFTTSPTAVGPLDASVAVDTISSGSPVQVATVTPVVTLSTADLAANATTITIAGFGFDPTKTNDSVVFNDGAVGTVTAATATSLTVTFSTKPTTAGSLTAVVTTDTVGSGAAVQVAAVTPVVTPSIINLPPNTTQITIAGFGFDPNKANDTVTFHDGAAGTVTTASPTSLTVTLSTGPTTAAGPPAVVTVDGANALFLLTTGAPGSVAAVGSDGAGETDVPPGLTNAVVVAARDYFALALRSDGTVAAWGDNDSGQTAVPQGLSNVVQVAAGGHHALALESDGTVVGWGNNNSGQTTVPQGLSHVVAIAAGEFFSLALESGGAVVGWGNNGSGQTTVPQAAQSGVVAIAVGSDHALALKSDGTVVAWGNDNSGQVSGLPQGLTGVVAIAAGDYFSLALKSGGTVVAWGNGDSGQNHVPQGLTGVVAIAAGGHHALAAKSDGTAVGWGNNANGQTDVSGLTGVEGVAAGEFYSLAVTAPQHLDAAGGEGPGGASALTEAQLQGAVDAALSLLTSAGVDPALVGRLASADYETGTLSPGVLGLTYASADDVTLSSDGAGYGWSADPSAPRAGQEDLQTAVLHEMGHLAGLPDADAPGLMDGRLAPGTGETEALDQVFAGL